MAVTVYIPQIKSINYQEKGLSLDNFQKRKHKLNPFNRGTEYSRGRSPFKISGLERVTQRMDGKSANIVSKTRATKVMSIDSIKEALDPLRKDVLEGLNSGLYDMEGSDYPTEEPQ